MVRQYGRCHCRTAVEVARWQSEPAGHVSTHAIEIQDAGHADADRPRDERINYIIKHMSFHSKGLCTATTISNAMLALDLEPPRTTGNTSCVAALCQISIRVTTGNTSSAG